MQENEESIKLLTIVKWAELTGITADTIRYYKKMRLIKATSRSEAGYRLYEEDSVGVIRLPTQPDGPHPYNLHTS